MSDAEKTEQKERVKENLLCFADNSDFDRILAPDSTFYKRLASIIKNDDTVRKNKVQNAIVYNKISGNKYDK